MLRTTIAFSMLVFASCSTLKGMTGGSSAKANDQGWAASMAEAPRYELPKVIEVKKPSCNVAGYTKLDVEQGKPFHLVATASASCASIELMTGTGAAASTAANSIEVCANTGPQTLVSVGQEGGTFVGVSERYGCTGTTVTLDAKPGEPAAGGAGTGTPAGGGGSPAGEPTEPPTL